VERVEHVRRIICGDLQGLSPDDSGCGDAAEQILKLVAQDPRPVPSDAIELHVNQLMSERKTCQALALLKVFAVADPDADRLRFILERILLREAARLTPLSDEELPASKFLGSERPHIAWTVLRRDRLSVAPEPEPDAVPVPDTWLVCRDLSTCSPEAPRGLNLLWRTNTPVAGKERAAGRRGSARHHVPLPARVTFLTSDAPVVSTRPYDAILVNLSEGGAGLRLTRPLGWQSPREPDAMTVRLEIPIHHEDRVLESRATVRWCRVEKDGEENVLSLGLRFYEPTQVFVQSIVDLIAQEKGDQHCLWNLWEAQTKAS
jgi:hypothetical protein